MKNSKLNLLSNLLIPKTFCCLLLNLLWCLFVDFSTDLCLRQNEFCVLSKLGNRLNLATDLFCVLLLLLLLLYCWSPCLPRPTNA